MKVTWVIERHIFEEEQELALIAEVKKQGGEVKLIDPLSKHNFNYWDEGYLLEDKSVVFRGSLNIGKKARQQAWYPGVIMDIKNFNCSTYYTYWGQWMLNKHYWLMPLAELYRDNFIEDCLESLYCPYYSDKVFIRPDSGMKQFAGGLFNLSDLSSLKGIEPETLILVAPIKQVDREWRFVVCDNKVITGSQYFEKGEYVSSQDSYLNNKAADYLDMTLKNINWLPDQIYCVDVCESEGEFSILELNSFSCSALYNCDLSKVVEVANNIAIREWKEVND
jgi:ATP-grasp domain, R2K clade family 2